MVPIENDKNTDAPGHATTDLRPRSQTVSSSRRHLPDTADSADASPREEAGSKPDLIKPPNHFPPLPLQKLVLTFRT